MKINFKKQFKFFNPEEFGLNPDFRLTDYASLKGCCSKVPQGKLKEYIKEIGDGSIGKETPDCAVYEVKDSKENYRQISTCDFFYPLISDPYLQGKIAVANVLSDVYAMGVPHVDNVLMILGVSKLMNEKEREVVTSEMIRGFNEHAIEAETKVTGGQSVMNPWPMIGGTAISVVKEEDIVYPSNIEVNDHLILTKPLGTQIAVNAIEWMNKKNDNYKKALEVGVSDNDIKEMFNVAVESMMRLNRKAASIMKKYNSHGATDITGFGFLGHARNLVQAQKSNMEFYIESLPLIRHTEKINKEVHNFELTDGWSAETSGGLLIAVDPNFSKEFINEMINSGEDAWIVGYVKESDDKKVTFSQNLEIISV